MDADLTIQEVAEQTGLSSHTLRYYERIGLIFPVARAGSGHRRYGQGDVEWIGFLKCLRGTGMPVREMVRFAELVSEGDHTIPERIALLKRHHERILCGLAELEHNLAAVEWKINHYCERMGDAGRPAPVTDRAAT